VAAMTFVGHSLVGASLAQATIPAGASWKQWAFIVNLYILLAFFPDFPFPGWGHFRYYFSHSLYVNLLLIVPTAAACCYWRCRRGFASYLLVAGGAVAWLSHFPLDAMYNHGRGVAIFWPFSEAALNLPLPWFVTLDMGQSLTSAYNARVFLVEALFYLPVFAAAMLARHLWLRRKCLPGLQREE
jgi:membrane-bound metal-dependent hydrolase YbcI (DUF457 family)